MIDALRFSPSLCHIEIHNRLLKPMQRLIFYCLVSILLQTLGFSQRTGKRDCTPRIIKSRHGPTGSISSSRNKNHVKNASL